MGIHRIHIDDPIVEGLYRVLGDEARHAVRVKRVNIGEGVELLDGRGGVGVGVVEASVKVRGEWVLDVKVETVKSLPRSRPRLEVCTALPKGAKLGDLIDGRAQVGAAVWRPLETAHGVREEWRRERVESIAREASKQSGRAWLMEVGEGMKFEDAVRNSAVVIADAGGEKFDGAGDDLRLLIGPEGGWTEGEIALARMAGARVCRFGVHTMRIETAAVVAAGVIMAGAFG